MQKGLSFPNPPPLTGRLAALNQHFRGGQLRGGSRGPAPASPFSPLLPNTRESCLEQRLSNVVREFRFYVYRSGITKIMLCNKASQSPVASGNTDLLSPACRRAGAHESRLSPTQATLAGGFRDGSVSVILLLQAGACPEHALLMTVAGQPKGQWTPSRSVQGSARNPPLPPMHL